jgi:DNA-binding PadR family transcriptional regulator
VSIDHPSRSRLSPEYALLGFLLRESNHGYDLHKMLMQNFGSIWHASQSQTYSILSRLKSQGYITVADIGRGKLPARQVLQITPSGRARFEAWLNQPTNSSVHAIRVEFITRLYFTQLYHPQNITDMIAEQIRMVETGVEQLQAEFSNLPSGQAINRRLLDATLQHQPGRSFGGWNRLRHGRSIEDNPDRVCSCLTDWGIPGNWEGF